MNYLHVLKTWNSDLKTCKKRFVKSDPDSISLEDLKKIATIYGIRTSRSTKTDLCVRLKELADSINTLRFPDDASTQHYISYWMTKVKKRFTNHNNRENFIKQFAPQFKAKTETLGVHALEQMLEKLSPYEYRRIKNVNNNFDYYNLLKVTIGSYLVKYRAYKLLLRKLKEIAYARRNNYNIEPNNPLSQLLPFMQYMVVNFQTTGRLEDYESEFLRLSAYITNVPNYNRIFQQALQNYQNYMIQRHFNNDPAANGLQVNPNYSFATNSKTYHIMDLKCPLSLEEPDFDDMVFIKPDVKDNSKIMNVYDLNYLIRALEEKNKSPITRKKINNWSQILRVNKKSYDLKKLHDNTLEDINYLQNIHKTQILQRLKKYIENIYTLKNKQTSRNVNVCHGKNNKNITSIRGVCMQWVSILREYIDNSNNTLANNILDNLNRIQLIRMATSKGVPPVESRNMNKKELKNVLKSLKANANNLPNNVTRGDLIKMATKKGIPPEQSRNKNKNELKKLLGSSRSKVSKLKKLDELKPVCIEALCKSIQNFINTNKNQKVFNFNKKLNKSASITAAITFLTNVYQSKNTNMKEIGADIFTKLMTLVGRKKASDGEIKAANIVLYLYEFGEYLEIKGKSLRSEMILTPPMQIPKNDPNININQFVNVNKLNNNMVKVTHLKPL
uniref:Uncharacterized protein n=1 Tax=viral metagenome TaxID=1070528 RepID=A0A6C0F9F5_9ZZZZ|tara:strand:- start:9162 stop:11180 length:2019 start_codon:yes stop_codon:yes gene_type:complete